MSPRTKNLVTPHSPIDAHDSEKFPLLTIFCSEIASPIASPASMVRSVAVAGGYHIGASGGGRFWTLRIALANFLHTGPHPADIAVVSIAGEVKTRFWR